MLVRSSSTHAKLGAGAQPRPAPCAPLRMIRARRAVSVSSGTQHNVAVNDGDAAPASLARRDLLLAVLSASAMGQLTAGSGPATAGSTGAAAPVKTYLPPTPGKDGFFTFVPQKDKTPALRSGAIERPYTIDLPGGWREERVANIKNGNYCQPKCGEPYTEAVFESEEEGRLEILNVPLFKLTPKPLTPLEKIGTPENILPRIGPYVTGTAFEDEDLVAQSTKVLDEGRTYYYYEIFAPYGTNGAHSYTAVTARGELVFVVFATATEKQWAKSEAKLRTMVESFRP